MLELLSESDTVCLPELYIVSIGVSFNRTSIIVMLSGTVVVKPCRINYKDSKTALLANIAYSNYDADANKLMKILGWKNLETQRQIHKVQMVYKSLNGLAPNYLSSKFIQRSDIITSYNLRDFENKLAVPLPRTNYCKNSFSYSSAILWNSLPSSIRKAKSLAIFRQMLNFSVS